MSEPLQPMVKVRFMVPPALAKQVADAAFACRTTRRKLWIAAMREFLGKAYEPGQAVPDAATGTETRTSGGKL